MPKRRFTPEQAQEIRTSTKSTADLAREHEVVVSTICNIRNGFTYRPAGTPMPPRRTDLGRPKKGFERVAKPCECNCGEMAARGSRFIVGHNARMEEFKQNYIKPRISRTPEEFLSATFANCVPEDRGYLDSNGTSSPCLIWQGPTDKRTGYVIAHVNGSSTTRHRHVYTILHGPLEPNVDVHHRCGTGNRNCMSPGHLVAIGRASHIRQHRSKLTEADVLEIHRLHAKGLGPKALSERYAMTQGGISNILAGDRWGDLKPGIDQARNGHDRLQTTT